MHRTSERSRFLSPHHRLPVFAPLVLFALVVCVPASSQSNRLVDAFLAEERASFGLSAYFVLAAANLLAEQATAAQAADALNRQGWRMQERPPDARIRLGEYCLLLMQALDVPGGILYRIFPVPRYAAREMDYRGFITGRSHPGRTLSGEEALRMLGRVLEWKEARR